MLSFHSIDERGIDIVRRVNERFPLIQIEICTDREIFILNPGVFSGAMSLADGIPHQSFKNLKMSRRAIGERSYLWDFRRWFREW